MTDQPGWCAVEHLAQDKAAGGGDRDDGFLKVDRPASWKRLQRPSLNVDACAKLCIVATAQLVDETTIGRQVGKVARAAHQHAVLDGLLEMPVGTLDRAVLMGDPGVV